MTERFEGSTIGDIVAADFRTAGVFERFGIDFCCGGRRSLEDNVLFPRALELEHAGATSATF